MIQIYHLIRKTKSVIPGAKRDAIFDYLKEVLPQNKIYEQQERMLGNILSEMKENGLIVPEGRTWFLKS